MPDPVLRRVAGRRDELGHRPLLAGDGAPAVCAAGACEELPESTCETAGGAFIGLTIPCEPSPCTTDYCTAGSAVCEEHIARIQIGRVDNASGCERYADYTHPGTCVVAGEQYLITVMNGLPFEGDVCSVWIDWNGDHIFEDVAPGGSATLSAGKRLAALSPSIHRTGGHAARPELRASVLINN